LCSTPFGIKDQYTKRQIKNIQIYASAQRLSASKISTHQGKIRTTCCLVCSTPFGIKDQYTLKSWEWILPTWCAQRLSASKISTPCT
jgi:hypothetical protein